MSTPRITPRPVEEIELQLLLEAIYQKSHYDFRGYSQASLARRMEQARQHFGCESLSMLQHKVLHQPSVFRELLNFLTVQVSELFRDPDYYRVLREQVIPHLKTYPSLKVWVAGCSDGEELYSLAILFREEGLESRTIFYATDINPAALRKAEAGVYALDRIPQFTRNHHASGARTSLSDYYTAAYGAVVFDKSLRAQTVFSEHSLVSDQVFAEVHLVSCRNVLIYFDKQLQDRAIALFEQSLVRGGFLGLGMQETLAFSPHQDRFDTFARDEKVYRKRLFVPTEERAFHG
ncbi:CheR family methyltransferase [Gellertiella hungarica]|uniref:Chemotaxis protein methyltransferase CheR n=1 Tax=Gellertiella hungarica TaxID=1572859 RepID=A0A7W6NL86_9HYPH|nr:CheR family methyltransferase [Gellertiella hungarica]MBB4066290.1 chemotaxis protein methyltransferase CheR [Gellertiella hungarica]